MEVPGSSWTFPHLPPFLLCEELVDPRQSTHATTTTTATLTATYYKLLNTYLMGRRRSKSMRKKTAKQITHQPVELEGWLYKLNSRPSFHSLLLDPAVFSCANRMSLDFCRVEQQVLNVVVVVDCCRCCYAKQSNDDSTKTRLLLKRPYSQAVFKHFWC